MKKSMMSNSKKIIIFALLIIGIILLSPMINNIVYAKSGVLPAELTKGIYKKGEVPDDDFTRDFDEAAKKYKDTPIYKANDKYLKKLGYTVGNPIQDAAEPWTTIPPKSQLFDNNFQETEVFKETSGYNLITNNSPALSAFNFIDLIENIDIYCSNKIIYLLQEADKIESALGLPEGSQLAARLRAFIAGRNEKLAEQLSRPDALGLDSGIASSDTVLDDYTASPSGLESVSIEEMEKTFGYIYPGATSSPTYPYVIKEIELENIGAIEIKKLIVPVVNGHQALKSDADYDLEKLMRWATSTFLKQMFDKAIDEVIKKEVGNLYYPGMTIDTDYNRIRDSPADSKGYFRTNNYFEVSSKNNYTLSPQAAYAVAIYAKDKKFSGYPGTTQDILWTLPHDQLEDGTPLEKFIVYVPESVEGKTYAESFEAYHKRFVEWKSKHSDKFVAEFLDTERKVIFNSKSEMYEGGAWLVGPYKLDYLLSTIKYNNEERYFAGMTGMTVTGKYNKNGAQEDIEIQKWRYFVPLQTAKTTLTTEEIVAGKVSSLKHGVPEPNQEFFIEIPYDENLIGISELKANFRGLDYKALADYHIGMGEYVDFSVDVAVERVESMAKAYKNVERPQVSFKQKAPGSDVGILTLTFNHDVYLTKTPNGQTYPFAGDIENPAVWTRVDGNIISREINYYDKGQNFNLAGFYYQYFGIQDKNGEVFGGARPKVSFSAPYMDPMFLSSNYQNILKQLYITKYSEGDDYIYLIPSVNVTTPRYMEAGKAYYFEKDDYLTTITFWSEAGQTATYDIPAKQGKLKVNPTSTDKKLGLFNNQINEDGVIETESITEIGKRNKSASPVVDPYTGFENVFEDGYTYVLHKLPDVLFVPKAKLIKAISQPQMSVEAEITLETAEAVLKEDLRFVLPIGGKVWEDVPYGKILKYDYILNPDQGESDTEKDKLLEGITVRVNRVIIRSSDSEIVEKQTARVYEDDEYKTIVGKDDIKTNEKGEWGKYYLKDLGFTREEITNPTKKYKASTHVVKFEIEFEYDGIEYIPVPPLASLDFDPANFTLETAPKAVNDSVAVENLDKRDEFNRNIGEINGDKPIVDSNKDKNERITEGKAIGVENTPGADLVLTYNGSLNENTNRTVSTLVSKNETGNPLYPMRASTMNTGLLYPIGDIYEVDMKQVTADSGSNEAKESYDLVVLMNREKAASFKNKTGVTAKDVVEDKTIVVFHASNTHMQNINLGLLKRRKVDLELVSDLMMTIQFVNKKALINNFANKYEVTDPDDNEFSYLISKYEEEHGDIQYQLDIYRADYIYRTAMYQDPELEEALKKEAERLADETKNNDKEGRELDIYLQYKQGITNYSTIDHAIISGLDMYYDKTMTPVLKALEKEIDDEEVDEGEAKNGTGKAAIAGANITIGTPKYRIVTQSTPFTREFDDVPEEKTYKDIDVYGNYKWTPKEATGGIGKLTSLDGSTYDEKRDLILPAKRRLEVLTNFKVNKNMIYTDTTSGTEVKNSIELGNKHHLTEVAGYATYNKYSGKVSGKVDVDSAPANVNLELLKFTKVGFEGGVKQDFSYLEDDASAAPMVALTLQKEAPREVSGRIWEEKRNRQVARVNMGDGVYNAAEGELPITEKIVALEERISVRAIDLSEKYKEEQGYDDEIFKTDKYYVDIPYIWPNTIEDDGISIGNLKDLVEFQSYERTDNNGEYKFTGVPAGNFVVQLPYITVGNEITKAVGILDNNKIETTKIVDAGNRDKSPQVYNGQDFKVSIYNAGDINTINETWLPSTPEKNHSYGRDSEFSRYMLYKTASTVTAEIGDKLEILNIEQDDFDDNTKAIIANTANMVAETPLINFGINYYGSVSNEHMLYRDFKDVFALPGITTTVDGQGNVLPRDETHTYENVNIALEERPKTKLVLDKEITKLTLKSSDGTKLVDAKYHTTYDTDNIVMPKEDKIVLDKEKADGKYDAKRKTNNGYNIEEYILKVKTKIDPDSINGDKVNPLNTVIYASSKPYWEESSSETYTNARGWENTSQPDPVSRTSNGYIHLNFDKQLLSDMNIEIEYKVQLYNLGEVDRATIQEDFKNQDKEDARKDDKISKYVGKLAEGTETYSQLNPEIEPEKYGFGRYFGRGYYTGEYNKTSQVGNYKLYEETVSKTYANKIIEYIDNSAVKDDLQNDDWRQIKNISELKDIIAAYDTSEIKSFELQSSMISDPEGKSYFKTGGSNIYINEKMNEGLVPYYEYATAVERGLQDTTNIPYELSSTIATKRLSSQQADEDLSFDNISEIVEYKTDNGRRSTSSTPGNVNTRLSETFDAQNLEPDTGLALLVTITPPTGLSKAQIKLITTLSILIPIMLGIAGVAVLAKVSINAKQKNKVLPNESGDNS